MLRPGAVDDIVLNVLRGGGAQGGVEHQHQGRGALVKTEAFDLDQPRAVWRGPGPRTRTRNRAGIGCDQRGERRVVIRGSTSASLEPTWAVSTRLAAEELGATVNDTVTLAPGASVPSTTATVPGDEVSVPWLEDIKAAELPGGRASSSITPVAAPDPWFVTIIV